MITAEKVYKEIKKMPVSEREKLSILLLYVYRDGGSENV